MIVAAIVLAAGAPARMGEQTALLAWGDETLVEFQVRQLQDAGADVVEVVVGPDADRIIPLVARDNVEPIVNPRWSAGAGGSLRAGAMAVPRDTATAIIVSVNEPRPAEVYRRLLDEHASRHAAIARPAFEGRPGTPVAVNRDVLAEVRNLQSDASGLEPLLARHASDVMLVPSDSDVVLLGIDTRDDYDAALRAFGLA